MHRWDEAGGKGRAGSMTQRYISISLAPMQTQDKKQRGAGMTGGNSRGAGRDAWILCM